MHEIKTFVGLELNICDIILLYYDVDMKEVNWKIYFQKHLYSMLKQRAQPLNRFQNGFTRNDILHCTKVCGVTV